LTAWTEGQFAILVRPYRRTRKTRYTVVRMAHSRARRWQDREGGPIYKTTGSCSVLPLDAVQEAWGLDFTIEGH
jgi:hypothetical protein